MRRHLSFLIAALFASALALMAPASAEATPYTAFPPKVTEASFLQPVGYYGGYHHKKSYDDYEPEESSDEDNDESYYKHKRRHYNGCGGGGYRQKYVCEQNEPRCFKQRECVWYYGREYCRYVRKCNGGEKYCKWISVPYNSCD